ncbi:MAG: hypothetical protein IT204_08140 [Fimbriimonadaceae bacterium]|nr:hypothetical protein [Fimbriimonadaceae bacterium]
MSGFDLVADRAAWAQLLATRRLAAALQADQPSALPQASAEEQRLCAIWDFRVVPHTLGDLVALLARTQVLRAERGCQKVDLAFLFDPQRPSRTRNYDANVTAENYHYLLPHLTTVAYLTRHLGSFFVFDSAPALEAHLTANLARYQLWPSAFEYFHQEDSFGHNHNAVQDFYDREGWVPYLEPRPATLRWVLEFWRQQIAPRALVTVHLRNNPAHDAHRNSALEQWFDFLAWAAPRYAATFVLVGSAKEIDPRFRELPNVLVAKDHGTSLEQDFVLVNAGQMFLGTNSGPSAMAIYSETPYAIFLNAPPTFEKAEEGTNWNFATPWQRLIWHRESSADIGEQFAQLWAGSSVAAWEAALEARAGQPLTRSYLLWDH